MSSVATPIIAGAAAIFGSFTGAAAAGFWSMRTERLRQTYAREESARLEAAQLHAMQGEIRAAAAEVMFELQNAAQMVEAFLTTGSLPREAAFRVEAWNNHRTRLGATLATAQWLVLARVFVALEALGQGATDDPDGLTATVAGSLRRSLDAAQLVLRPLTDLPEQEVRALAEAAEGR
jgi:hypothetical protein